MTTPVVAFYFDITNARIEPLPDGVPTGLRLRAVGTDLGLTVLWLSGGQGAFGRVDIPLSVEQMAGANYEGGQVGPYQVSRSSSGCSSCNGGSALMQIVPFPDTQFIQRMPPGQVYGVPSSRVVRYYRA